MTQSYEEARESCDEHEIFPHRCDRCGSPEKAFFNHVRVQPYGYLCESCQSAIRDQEREAELAEWRKDAVDCLILLKSVVLVWGDMFAPGTAEEFAAIEKRILDRVTKP